MTGFFIPVDLFIRAAGLQDSRNNMKRVCEIIEQHGTRIKGYLWYHTALVLAKYMQKSGEFFMYQEDIAEHILNFLDDMISAGQAAVTYR